MKNANELLEEAVYAGNLSENEEKKLYSWIESLILAKRKADEYEAKAKLADDIITAWKTGDFDFTEGEGSLPDHGIAPTPNYHMFDFGQYVDSLLDEYESGESDELRE